MTGDPLLRAAREERHPSPLPAGRSGRSRGHCPYPQSRPPATAQHRPGRQPGRRRRPDRHIEVAVTALFAPVLSEAAREHDTAAA